MKVIRLERTLHKKLSDSTGCLGTIEWIYEHGLYVLGSDGHPFYFIDGKLLHIPFGIIVDQLLEKWTQKVFLQKGDRLFKKGHLIYRWSENDCNIQFLPKEVIDLNRTLYKFPPSSEIIMGWIKCLANEILNGGRFEGMGGTLTVLRDRFSQLIPESSFPLSLCSRYALSDILCMLRSTANGDLEGFQSAWEKLIGLGPGLTPSADDMLLGFLASQKILSSCFWKKIKFSKLKTLLVEVAREKTTPIASEFLRYALEGVFSEILYNVFEALSQSDASEIDSSAIKLFLEWGHSSGTDTLVGVVLGLTTLC